MLDTTSGGLPRIIHSHGAMPKESKNVTSAPLCHSRQDGRQNINDALSRVSVYSLQGLHITVAMDFRNLPEFVGPSPFADAVDGLKRILQGEWRRTRRLPGFVGIKTGTFWGRSHSTSNPQTPRQRLWVSGRDG